MKGKRSLPMGIAICVGMFVLILDSKTALSGAAAGVDLCVKTVIPSLFPFFVLTAMLTGMVTGIKLPFMSSVGRLCGIPKGAESVLLVGLLGGYPMGAQSLCQAYTAGLLNKADTRRMLGFCNNAGPAFLFGMVQSLFSSPLTAFILWGIHILSALIVGMCLPKYNTQSAVIPADNPITLSQALQRSISAMAAVCGWVVLFRVVLAFAENWFLWLLPMPGQVLLSGILELANGCLGLHRIPDESIRFLFASLLLSFGGICVGMQTIFVTAQAGLDSGFYFPGKLLQSSISVLLSLPVMQLLFPQMQPVGASALFVPVAVACIVMLFLRKSKNNSSFPSQAGV